MAGEPAGGAGPGARDIPEINTNVPHPARVHNYFLGGEDNFEADRAAAEAAIKAFPKTARGTAPPGNDPVRHPQSATGAF